MNSRIDMFRQKAEDPTELAKKIAEVKQDLDISIEELRIEIGRIRVILESLM